MPGLNAQLGIAQIKKLRKFIKLKRLLFDKYKNAFLEIKGLKLMKEMKFKKQLLITDNNIE